MSISVFADADARKGKRIWKKNCRIACHDGSKADVPTLSPVSKTQAQWEELKNKIKECSQKANLTDEDIANMYEYLHSHALDSDQPETCG